MRDARMVAVFVIAVALLLAIGSCQTAQPTVVERPVTVVVPQVVTATPGAGGTPGTGGSPLGQVPFEAQWSSSGHADAEAAAFTHWNEEDPREILVACAKCHSTFGFQDYLGADGSAPLKVDKAAATGSTITCVACHNQQAAALDSVVFPSGVTLTGIGPSARCETCHQGTASMVQVTQAISNANVSDVDTVSDKLAFVNIHYYASAATLHGAYALGGYQYEGKQYPVQYPHVEQYDTCIECHDPHTTQVRINQCGACHQGVTKLEDLHNVRMAGSLYDFDGDGNIQEGIYSELQGVQAVLYKAIQAYGTEVSQKPIVYDAATYPYFFNDTNGNGTGEQDELAFPNAYKSWTPRLLKAAYNYQVSVKDPGSFAHNNQYILALLRDSIDDLNVKLTTKIDVSKMQVLPVGHFTSSSEAFRHWDAEGVVPGGCVKCHTAEGLPVFLREGTNISTAPSSRLECATCHSDLVTFARYDIKSVRFPSGATLSLSPDSNACLHCHEARTSLVDVNRAVANIGDDVVTSTLRFINPHYFTAAATLFGSEAQGAYQYQGKTYARRFMHVENYQTCEQCHDAHNLQVKVQACGGCHQGVTTVEDLRGIRQGSQDYVPSGGPGLGGDVAALQATLFKAIQSYATSVSKAGIAYDAAAYPYFFADKNNNGTVDADEAAANNAFAAWTPRLLKAAYNYQWSQKDPGAYAHNGEYMVQVLYDSAQDLGTKVTVDLAGVRRP